MIFCQCRLETSGRAAAEDETRLRSPHKSIDVSRRSFGKARNRIESLLRAVWQTATIQTIVFRKVEEIS